MSIIPIVCTAATTFALVCANSPATKKAVKDSRPQGAVATDPKVVVGYYANRTFGHRDSRFVYWGMDGTYRGAIKDFQTVRLGKWYVTKKSRMCFEGHKYRLINGQTISEPEKECRDFVTDPAGKQWHQKTDSNYRWSDAPLTKSWKRGETYRIRLRRAFRKLGLM